MSEKNNGKDAPYTLSDRLQDTDIPHVEGAIITKTRTVSCDGGDEDLGHPKVYLEIVPNDDSIICPYCSQEFKLAA